MTTVETAAPATAQATDSRWAELTLAVVRVGVAFLWIENAGWKTPPRFGSLRSYTEDAITHPVFAPFTWVVRHVVLPNFTFFAWFTLLVEASIGAFLLVGLLTRLWASIGLIQVLAITFSALNAPHEWEWSYYLMILAHLALIATAAGRCHGLDRLLRPRWLRSRRRVARALVRFS